MPADIASAAAAVTAGYTKTQLDRGASANPRYSTRFEKHLTQQAGASVPVSEVGRLVLETIYAVFKETRDWPTYNHVERALDKHSW